MYIVSNNSYIYAQPYCTSNYIDIWEYLLFLLQCTSTAGPGYIHLDNGVSLVPKGNLLPFPVLLASATAKLRNKLRKSTSWGLRCFFDISEFYSYFFALTNNLMFVFIDYSLSSSLFSYHVYRYYLDITTIGSWIMNWDY